MPLERETQVTVKVIFVSYFSYRIYALLVTLDVTYYLQKTKNVYHDISCLVVPTVFKRVLKSLSKGMELWFITTKDI